MTAETSPRLAEAYSQTRYFIPDGGVSVYVGKTSAALDQLLDREEASKGAFLTACNPGSLMASADRNKEATQELEAVLKYYGYRYLISLNVPEDPEWVEPSFFVMDLEPDTLVSLAEAHGQKAFVVAEKGAEAQLVWTAGSP